jgi:hypothetical protein
VHLEEEGALLGAIEDELEVGADAAGEPEAKMNPCKSELLSPYLQQQS